jgi:hypothetical protein
VARKRGKGAAKKTTARRTAKRAHPAPAAKRAASPTRRTKAATTKPPAEPAPTAPAPRPTAPAPTLLEEAERFRDEIQRTKLCHPDPWTYTPKARGWAQQAQAIVERIATGDEGGGARDALAQLRAAVEADPDFQEARRLL